MGKIYENNKSYTIKEGCPWYEAQQTYGPSNLNLCERSSCTYLDEPVNTVSNLAIVLIGFILVKVFKRPMLKFYGLIAIMMGLLSFVYHATNNGLTQYLDFLGMFLFSSFVLSFNLLRFVSRSPIKLRCAFIVVYCLHLCTLIPVYFWEMPIQYTLLGSAVPIVLLDVFAGLKERTLSLYKYACLSIVFFGVAQTFAILDAQKIYCNPDNFFFHGHVLWHLFVSVGVMFYGLHIRNILNFREGEVI